MRQVLMGLIIVSLAVMLGCVVHFGVYCKNATAGQPTPAKKEAPRVAVPAPKALPQVAPDQAKDVIPDQVRVDVQRSRQVRVSRSYDCVGVVDVQRSRQVRVSNSCDCRAPRLTLLERLRHPCHYSCEVKVEKTKVVRQKCYKGSGCGCGCG